MARTKQTRKQMLSNMALEKRKVKRKLSKTMAESEISDDVVADRINKSLLDRIQSMLPSSYKAKTTFPLSKNQKRKIILKNILPFKPLKKNVQWLTLRQQDSKNIVSLTTELECFANYVGLSQAERDSRDNMIQEITETVTSKWPHARINQFGSYSAGLSIFQSDIDISILGLGVNNQEEEENNGLAKNTNTNNDAVTNPRKKQKLSNDTYIVDDLSGVNKAISTHTNTNTNDKHDQQDQVLIDKEEELTTVPISMGMSQSLLTGESTTSTSCIASMSKRAMRRLRKRQQQQQLSTFNEVTSGNNNSNNDVSNDNTNSNSNEEEGNSEEEEEDEIQWTIDTGNNNNNNNGNNNDNVNEPVILNVNQAKFYRFSQSASSATSSVEALSTISAENVNNPIAKINAIVDNYENEEKQFQTHNNEIYKTIKTLVQNEQAIVNDGNINVNGEIDDEHVVNVVASNRHEKSKNNNNNEDSVAVGTKRKLQIDDCYDDDNSGSSNSSYISSDNSTEDINDDDSNSISVDNNSNSNSDGAYFSDGNIYNDHHQPINSNSNNNKIVIPAGKHQIIDSDNDVSATRLNNDIGIASPQKISDNGVDKGNDKDSIKDSFDDFNKSKSSNIQLEEDLSKNKRKSSNIQLEEDLNVSFYNPYLNSNKNDGNNNNSNNKKLITIVSSSTRKRNNNNNNNNTNTTNTSASEGGNDDVDTSNIDSSSDSNIDSDEDRAINDDIKRMMEETVEDNNEIIDYYYESINNIDVDEDEDDDEDNDGMDFTNSFEPDFLPSTINKEKQALDKAKQQKQLELLRVLFPHLKTMDWVSKLELRSKARVPIINLQHRNSIECDISVGVTAQDTSRVVQGLVEACGHCLFQLSSFLKIFLNHLELDMPFSGGLGSYKLYVMVAYHIKQNPDMIRDKEHPNLGLLLLTFLQYFGNHKNLNSKTELRVLEAEVSFDRTMQIVLIQQAFSIAYNILNKICNDRLNASFQRVDKDKKKDDNKNNSSTKDQMVISLNSSDVNSDIESNNNNSSDDDNDDDNEDNALIINSNGNNNTPTNFSHSAYIMKQSLSNSALGCLIDSALLSKQRMEYSKKCAQYPLILDTDRDKVAQGILSDLDRRLQSIQTTSLDMIKQYNPCLAARLRSFASVHDATKHLGSRDSTSSTYNRRNNNSNNNYENNIYNSKIAFNRNVIFNNSNDSGFNHKYNDALLSHGVVGNSFVELMSKSKNKKRKDRNYDNDNDNNNSYDNKRNRAMNMSLNDNSNNKKQNRRNQNDNNNSLIDYSYDEFAQFEALNSDTQYNSSNDKKKRRKKNKEANDSDVIYDKSEFFSYFNDNGEDDDNNTTNSKKNKKQKLTKRHSYPSFDEMSSSANNEIKNGKNTNSKKSQNKVQSNSNRSGGGNNNSAEVVSKMKVATQNHLLNLSAKGTASNGNNSGGNNNGNNNSNNHTPNTPKQFSFKEKAADLKNKIQALKSKLNKK